MPYFTSWDTNVFLCLLSLGLPEDLVKAFVKKIKRTHEELELKNARDFHCDRGEFVDMSEWQMLYYSRAELCDRDWHFPKAISNLSSIPLQFHQKYSDLVEYYIIEYCYLSPNDRSIYFKQSGPGGAKEWTKYMIKWFEGFHPGRFFLMDRKYINSLERNGWRGLWRIDGTEDFVNWYNSVFEGKKHIEEFVS